MHLIFVGFFWLRKKKMGRAFIISGPEHRCNKFLLIIPSISH